MTTNTKVIDASALAAILFGEEEGYGLAPLLDDAALAAPTLLAYEITNICLKKMRAVPALRDELRNILRSFAKLGVALHTVEYVDVVDLADNLHLSAYDASYLWLARHLGADLITLDKKKLLAASSQR